MLVAVLVAVLVVRVGCQAGLAQLVDMIAVAHSLLIFPGIYYTSITYMDLSNFIDIQP